MFRFVPLLLILYSLSPSFAITRPLSFRGLQLTAVSSPVSDKLPYVVGTSYIVLTDAAPQDANAVYLSSKQVVSKGFSVSFSFSITNRTRPLSADGFAFVIQNNNVDTIGQDGRRLGYGGIRNSIAVEFDCFMDTELNDPNDNHVSVHTAGLEPNSAMERSPKPLVIGGLFSRICQQGQKPPSCLPRFTDGQVHNVSIVFNAEASPQSSRLHIFVDSLTSPTFSVLLDVGQTLSLDPSGSAFIGFTGSTGDLFQQQNIHSLNFTTLPGPEQSPIFSTTSLIVVVTSSCLAVSVCVFVLVYRARRVMRMGKGYARVPQGPSDESSQTENVLVRTRVYLRGVDKFRFEAALPDIGWRTNKAYVKVSKISDGKPCVVCGIEIPPCLKQILSVQRSRSRIRDILCIAEVPFVQKIVDVDFSFDLCTLFVVKPFYSNGSLRDWMYKANPILPYASKYVRAEIVPLDKIALYGRMMLEALQGLRNAGYPPCASFHLGNVFLTKTGLEVADFEDGILGLSPRVSDVVENQSIVSRVDADTIAFGCALFEMATADILSDVAAASVVFSTSCDPVIASILDSIFRPAAKPMTIKKLLQNPFFMDVKLPAVEATSVPLDKDDIALVKEMLLTIRNSSTEHIQTEGAFSSALRLASKQNQEFGLA